MHWTDPPQTGAARSKKKWWISHLSWPKPVVSWLSGSQLNHELAQWESAKMAAQPPMARLS